MIIPDTPYDGDAYENDGPDQMEDRIWLNGCTNSLKKTRLAADKISWLKTRRTGYSKIFNVN